jgi:bifunctional DNA-binding transcriptional regulator/antitoxin component of YhaV-PrlF toxin-antitoxin module
MEQDDRRTVHKYFGSAVVGPRGQLVIPVEARRELGIAVGTKLLAFNLPQGAGILLIKVEAVEDLVNAISREVKYFTKLLTEAESSDSNGPGY